MAKSLVLHHPLLDPLTLPTFLKNIVFIQYTPHGCVIYFLPGSCFIQMYNDKSYKSTHT